MLLHDRIRTHGKTHPLKVYIDVLSIGLFFPIIFSTFYKENTVFPCKKWSLIKTNINANYNDFTKPFHLNAICFNNYLSN